MYFTLRATGLERELWVTNGTEDGTVRLATLGNEPGAFTEVDGSVYFPVRTGSTTRLWFSDGTQDGTRVVATTAGNRTAEWTQIDTQLIGLHGNSLNAFTLGSDAINTIQSFRDRTHNILITGGHLYFHSHHGDTSTLWKTDGTDTGTESFVTLDGVFWHQTALGNKWLFTLVENDQIALWESDGTQEGTRRLRWLGAGTPGEFVDSPFDDLAFLVLNTERYGEEVWVTDGTAAGTHVYDINPGPSSSVSDDTEFAIWNDELYFGARTRNTGQGLWKIDGEMPLAADFDRNGTVDFADFLALSASFGKQGSDVSREDGDVNGDQMVDFADFLFVSTQFGSTGSVPVQFSLTPKAVDEVLL